jgi:hypothetical protein
VDCSLSTIPLAEAPISLSARRVFYFYGHFRFYPHYLFPGQEAGIRTRTVHFTGGDAAVTPQSCSVLRWLDLAGFMPLSAAVFNRYKMRVINNHVDHGR